MRLTLVIHSMASGGAQRVMAISANSWAARGWPVTLLTLSDSTVPCLYELHPAIRYRPLGLARASHGLVEGAINNARRTPALRKAITISRPDVVISFIDETNVQVLAATIGTGLPVIVAEHTDPAPNPPPRPWRLLRQVLYPCASRVVVLSETAKAYFPWTIRRKAVVIPNPVLPPPPVPPAECDRTERRSGRLTAIGRLSPEKGFDLLLRAFAEIAPRHPNWSLVVWGEGAERSRLETLRDELGLGGRAHFPGWTSDVYAELRRSDLFVMSSRYEGFPMALCEALAAGVPAVSFDCPSGPRQIIRPGIDGVLVPPADVGALARALDALMGDEKRRQRLAARGPEVVERFGVERVMSMWDELFRDVAPRPRSQRLRMETMPGPSARR